METSDYGDTDLHSIIEGDNRVCIRRQRVLWQSMDYTKQEFDRTKSW